MDYISEMYPFKHKGVSFGWYAIHYLISHERSIKDVITDYRYRLTLDHHNIYMLGYPLLMKYKTYINKHIYIHNVAIYSIDDDKVYSYRADVGYTPDNIPIYGIGLLPDGEVSFVSRIRNIFKYLSVEQQDVIILYYYNCINDIDTDINLPDIDSDVPELKPLCDGFGITTSLATLVE